MTKAKPAGEPTSFKSAAADGRHSASPPGLASAHKPKSTNGRIPKAKRTKLTDAEQSAEFERVSREHGADGDEAHFNDTLRKLARPKTKT